MKLNCRPGDIAVIVSVPYYCGVTPQPWAVGRIVRVIQIDHQPDDVPGWVMEEPLTSPCGRYTGNSIADCHLRPLRDGEGEDEILHYAGKPQDLTQPAPAVATTGAPAVSACASSPAGSGAPISSQNTSFALTVMRTVMCRGRGCLDMENSIGAVEQGFRCSPTDSKFFDQLQADAPQRASAEAAC